MDEVLLRFVAVLRARGVRISVAEVTDASRALATVGLRRREPVRLALEAALIKDSRDLPVFTELFDLFFRLRAIKPPEDEGHSHAHDDLTDTGGLHDFTVSEEPSATPEKDHTHDEPVDIRDHFDPEDLRAQYNLHQEANKIDLASLTDELVLSADQQALQGGAAVQLETERLSGAGAAKDLATAAGTRVDAELSIAEHAALEALLGAQEQGPATEKQLEGNVSNLPELLKRHLERFLALGLEVEPGGAGTKPREVVSEADRRDLEEVLARLGRQLHGALTHRKRPAHSGRVDVSRTMARNRRYDGVPFQPVTVARREDKPRLVVLTDASLSVRNTARFTVHLVHGLQRMFPRVRTYAFVDDLVDVSAAFERHGVDEALSVVFGSAEIDVDASSDYGRVFDTFASEHLSTLTRRTTLLVLGDGRGNGKDPGMESLERMRRQCRRLVWLTPEPRYSWGLGSCDMPAYVTLCDRVEVVRDVSGLDGAVRTLAEVLS